MRLSSMIPLCCVFASFSVALAGQARADQEISLDYNKFQYPDEGVFGGWASCQGVPIPNNCVTATDTISYNLSWNWESGYARADRVNFRQQVSPGDSAYSQIALYCDDGSFGFTDYPFGDGQGGDGQLPPIEVYSSCANGGAYEAVFTYMVETTGAG
jgi:hypothetical protein